MKFFIAAPFGNYLKFNSHSNIIPVTGTWTLKHRGGLVFRIWRIIKTMRYDRKNNGWTNKLGLPNPGIYSGLKRINPNEVLSIAAIESDDFNKLSKIIPTTQSLEINLSCPNLDDKKPLSWHDAALFTDKKNNRKYCIAKISPETTKEQLSFLIDQLGFSQIHCCNTLPVKEGGLSGKSLIPYVENLIKVIRENWGDSVEIIAGGGVNSSQDAINYINLGANYISLGTICFSPWKIKKIINS
mgnify:FL=1